MALPNWLAAAASSAANPEYPKKSGTTSPTTEARSVTNPESAIKPATMAPTAALTGAANDSDSIPATNVATCWLVNVCTAGMPANPETMLAMNVPTAPGMGEVSPTSEVTTLEKRPPTNPGSASRTSCGTVSGVSLTKALISML